MRQFIRHPVDVPIEIRSGQRDASAEFHTQDISLGGLAVHSAVAVEPGALIEVCIPYVRGNAPSYQLSQTSRRALT